MSLEYIFICSILLCGCATVNPITTSAPQFTGMPGIYHCVEKGQTLWAISKMYGVDLEELAKVNRISDAAQVEINQLVFIPSRNKPQGNADNYSKEDFAWPIKGRVIATFGQVHNNMLNKGINILAKNPDVFASRSGKVVFYAPAFKGYGKTIIIDHGDGFSSVYARNSEVFIKIGDSVEKGALIAKVGLTAKDKNKYLHFEIRRWHIPQNPYYYLP